MSVLLAHALCLSALSSSLGGVEQSLRVGDKLPDCSKIPLLTIDSEYRPATHRVVSVEHLLNPSGVAIVHFASPRPVDRSQFAISLVEEVSALQRAAQSVPYACRAIAVLPFGEKARADANVLLNLPEAKPWGDPQIYYEPTYPRPGLYRTFHPGADDYGKQPIVTPYTYIIGPDRTVLAMRGPDDPADLQTWLLENLPSRVIPVSKPASTAISIPKPDTWVWPTFRRDGEGRPEALRLPDTLPYTYLAWRSSIGRTFASPVVIDDTVYINTDSGGLKAVSLIDGQILHTFGVGATWWSSPAVAGEFLYTSSSNGAVLCIERGSLQVKWRRELHGLITSSPLVSGGALYLGSRNGSVYALDCATGVILWRFQTGGEISSSPTIHNGVLFIGSGDRHLYALDAKTGDQKWTYATGGPVDSSPAVSGDSIIFGSFDGAVYSVYARNGQLQWRCQLEGWVHSSPAVSGETAFVGTVSTQQGVPATFNWIDVRTGQRKGKFDIADSVYSSPTIWADTVLVGCRDYHLYAFDRAMRQTQPKWTFKTRSYVHASPVVVGDTVLVASFDGGLYALRQPKPISKWKDTDIVPRWFIAAMAYQLHRETADQIASVARGKVGDSLRLTGFDAMFKQVSDRASQPSPPPKALPRDVPPDLPGALYVEYVLTAGLLSGFPDGSFQPNEPSSRYQFSHGLANVLFAVARPDYSWKVLGERGLTAQVEFQIVPPAGILRTAPVDVHQNHWAYQALMMLATNGLLPTDSERRFSGMRIVTLANAREQWDRIVSAVRIVRTK